MQNNAVKHFLIAMAIIIIYALTMILTGCHTIHKDRSVLTAKDAGDKTLVQSACHAGPTVGFDICKVYDGHPITEVWKLIVPWDSRVEYGGVRIRWRDRVKTYPVTSSLVSIPFKDIIGDSVWRKDHEAPIQAQVGLRSRDNDGQTVWIDLLGYAFLIILTDSYHPMFIDSGEQFFETDCKVQYSSAGRSAIRCK